MPEVIGQQGIKKILHFHTEGFQRTQFFPPTLFNAPMGEGKTLMMKSLAKTLNKPAVLVNCATIKSVDSMVKSLIFDLSNQYGEYTILADEFHALDKSVQNVLLTLLAPSETNKNQYTHTKDGNSIVIDFDFTKITFLAATTNLEAILPPLADRFRVHGIEAYKREDLFKILDGLLKKHLIVAPEIIDKIIDYVRVNPRSCLYFTQDIKQFCDGRGLDIFDAGHWEEFKEIVRPRRYGITAVEERLLDILRGHILGCRLTALASQLRMDNKSVQSLERYLINQGLMQTHNSIRSITNKGKEYFTI